MIDFQKMKTLSCQAAKKTHPELQKGVSSTKERERERERERARERKEETETETERARGR